MSDQAAVDRSRKRIDDEERLVALRSYRIMDTAPEANYERLVELLQAACTCAWAAVTFVDRDRQWFKAIRGLDAKETPRAMSFCSIGMQQLAPLIVENAMLDARFRDNLLVIGRGLRFFAGYPLFSNDGYGLGSVCVLDTRPRTLLTNQLALVEKARNWVQADLDRRRASFEWKDGVGYIGSSDERRRRDQNQSLKKASADRAWETFLTAAKVLGVY